MAHIPRSLLSQSAKDYVRRAVASGVLPADSRVSIDCLVRELDISPTPIREGLAQLVAEGFLQQRPNRGFHVLPLTMREMSELYPIGAALEDLGLRAAPPPSTDRLAELRCLNSRMQSAPEKDPEALILLNQEWHHLLISGCDNQQLFRMIAQLRARSFRYEHVCYAFDRADMVNQFKMHAEVLDALEQGDIESAATKLRDHWQVNLGVVIRSGESVFAESDDY